MKSRPTAPGVYDEPISRALADALAELAPGHVVHADIDPHHAPTAIGRVIHEHVVRALSGIKGDDRAARQLALANRVIDVLTGDASGITEHDHLVPPPRALLAVLAPSEPPAVPRRLVVGFRDNASGVRHI